MSVFSEFIRVVAGILLIVAAVINLVSGLGNLVGGGGASYSSSQTEVAFNEPLTPEEMAEMGGSLQEAKQDVMQQGTTSSLIGLVMILSVGTSIAGAVFLFLKKKVVLIGIAGAMVLLAELSGMIWGLGYSPYNIPGLLAACMVVLIILVKRGRLS